MLKIIKPVGKPEYPEIRFTCWRCGQAFVADSQEYMVIEEHNEVDALFACPACGAILRTVLRPDKTI